MTRLGLGGLRGRKQTHNRDGGSVVTIRTFRNALRVVLGQERLVLLEGAAEAKEPKRFLLHRRRTRCIARGNGGPGFAHRAAKQARRRIVYNRCLAVLVVEFPENGHPVLTQGFERSGLDEAFDGLAVDLAPTGAPLEVLERRIGAVGPLLHDLVDRL